MTPEELAAVGLQVNVEGAVATVTLDRPEVRNAQTPAMWRGLAAVGERLVADDEVRVVVVRGAGTTFSAGLDRAMLDPTASSEDVESVADLLSRSEEEMSATIDDYQRGFTWLRDPSFVSIAAVQGYAVGAGFQLALACDLRVLTDDAQLCMKEAALVTDLTGTKPLVEAVGYSRALEICATARMVGAEEAVRIGIALTAVPTDQLAATVAHLVESLTAPMAGAVRETKALLQTAAALPLDEQRRLEREAQGRRFREVAGATQQQ